MPRKLQWKLTKWCRVVLFSSKETHQSLAQAQWAYESAVKQGARMYAAESLREATILLECSREQYRASRFFEAQVLAELAQQKAVRALAQTEESKCEIQENIQTRARSISEELGAIEASIQDILRTSSFDSVGQEWNTKLRSALTDFSDAMRFLKTDEFNSAQAHLAYTQALLEHLKKEVEDYKHTPAFGPREEVLTSQGE